jgi:hypothetical protein
VLRLRVYALVPAQLSSNSEGEGKGGIFMKILEVKEDLLRDFT